MTTHCADCGQALTDDNRGHYAPSWCALCDEARVRRIRAPYAVPSRGTLEMTPILGGDGAVSYYLSDYREV